MDPEATKKMAGASMHDISQGSLGYFNQRDKRDLGSVSGMSEIMRNSEGETRVQTGLVDEAEPFRNFKTV